MPTCANTVIGVFCVFWFLLGVLCIWGVLVFLGSLLCTRLGLHWCASCWTRPLGVGSVGALPLESLEENVRQLHKIAHKLFLVLCIVS